MSYSVDINVLLCVSDQSNSRHQAAIRFLNERSSDPEVFFLAWPAIMAYLRISTHPRIFASPLSPVEALANIQAHLRLPRVRTLAEDEGFLDVYREVTGDISVRGNHVPDAHLAALLRQHDVRALYAADVDFKRFSLLEVRNPLI